MTQNPNLIFTPHVEIPNQNPPKLKQKSPKKNKNNPKIKHFQIPAHGLERHLRFLAGFGEVLDVLLGVGKRISFVLHVLVDPLLGHPEG